jgi:hypothetical protein
MILPAFGIAWGLISAQVQLVSYGVGRTPLKKKSICRMATGAVALAYTALRTASVPN